MKKAIEPQSTAKSTPRKKSQAVTITPVIRLVRDLITKYCFTALRNSDSFSRVVSGSERIARILVGIVDASTKRNMTMKKISKLSPTILPRLPTNPPIIWAATLGSTTANSPPVNPVSSWRAAQSLSSVMVVRSLFS